MGNNCSPGIICHQEKEITSTPLKEISNNMVKEKTQTNQTKQKVSWKKNKESVKTQDSTEKTIDTVEQTKKSTGKDSSVVKKQTGPESVDNTKDVTLFNIKQCEQVFEFEHQNIIPKEIQFLTNELAQRIIILQCKEENPAMKPIQKVKTQSRKSQEKIKISVDWGEFIKFEKKNFTEDYILGDELGKGGYGTVCKVMMKTNKLQRAMKTIKKSSLFHQDEKRIFVQMSVLKEMDHPNIIKLYSAYDWKNYYYLITELCEGGNLFQRIRKNRSFSEKQAAEIMKQIISPIAYMHKKHYIHRDLKPENLLFSSKGEGSCLKIIDFGTARKFDPSKNLKKIVGTSYYIAPEVLAGNYNEKCDVWSCGVILYILLSGCPPFKGITQKEILYNVKNADLSFERRQWQKISQEAKDLISKMLRRDPAKRLSAIDVLNSPWINECAKENELQIQVFKNLENFHFQNKMKAVVMTYIASQIYSSKDKAELEKVFKEIDQDGDGVIQREELINAFQHHYRDHNLLDVNSLLKIIDTNNSGKIDFTEFLVAASTQQKMLTNQSLENAFSFFDRDGQGFITLDEIKAYLNDTEKNCVELFQSIDVNHDGKISKQQFKKMLLSNK